MGIAQKVVDELNKGVSQEELARKYPWNSLTKDDISNLLTIALRLGDNERSYTWLVYLFNVSFGKDLWFSTEVLSQTLQHPLMTLLDRQAILPTMRSQLDQLKDQINAKVTPPEKLNKYWLMEATYYSVKGNHLAENGNRGEAVQNYQVAQSIFEQLGLLKQVAEYKALIKRLLNLDAYRSPLPKTSPIRLRSLQTEPMSPDMLTNPHFQTLEAPAQVERPGYSPAEAGQAARPVETRRSDPVTAAPLERQPSTGVGISAEAEVPVAAAGNPAFSETTQPADLSSTRFSAGNSPETVEMKPESLAISGIYYPLPDVWLENGQLHILGINEFKGDESMEQAEQVRQQCEILIGLQLQIKMYHIRRGMLAEEMKVLEAKAHALKERIERQEKKLAKTESLPEQP